MLCYHMVYHKLLIKDYIVVLINHKHIYVINVVVCYHVLKKWIKYLDNLYNKFINKLLFVKFVIIMIVV